MCVCVCVRRVSAFVQGGHADLVKGIRGMRTGAGATPPGLHQQSSSAPRTLRDFNEAISSCRRQGQWQAAVEILKDARLFGIDKFVSRCKLTLVEVDGGGS